MHTLPTAPQPTDSNLDHALLYHSMGGWVFPGYSPLDEVGYRQALIRQGMSPEDAYQKAKRALKHTFEPWAERRKLGEAGRPTEAEIREWFDGEPARPVIILTGPSTCTEGQIVGVDVDTSKGGDATPWIGPEVTMLASTPSGGYHAYHLADNAEVFKNSEKGVAPGVDIRAAGGLLVAPSGEEATPGRKWLRWGAMSPVPGDEIRQRLAARKGLARAAVDAEDEDAIPPPPAQRGFTQACLEPTDKTQGGRMSRMKALTGPLAWLHPLPPDAVDAALSLLTEDAQDRGIEEEQIAELAVMWREALEADSRSLRFVLTVLHAWNNLRCVPRWSSERLESQVRSTWQTSNAREREFKAKQGAGHAPEVAEVAEGEETEQPAVEAPETEAPSGGVFKPPTMSLANCYINLANEAVSRATGGKVKLTAQQASARALPRARAAYGRKQFLEKIATPILSCAVLPAWQTITRDGIVPDESNPNGHGFGPEIDKALAGGLRPGYFAVLGAKTAKAGKTALADQLIDGLGLRSLDVLAKLARGEPTKDLIVVRYDLSEMSDGDMADRQLGRWLGIDSTTFRRGDQAHLAPGILRRAPDLHIPPRQLADMVIEAGGDALEIGRLADLRDLRATVDIGVFPSKADLEKDTDCQAGVHMLRRAATFIKTDRRVLAELWNVPESQICPLLFVDPIQRFQGSGDGDAVGALDGFAKALKEAATELRAIVFATSDTNKDSATSTAKRNASDKTGKDTRSQGERVASTLRGSYGLTHGADLTLVLDIDDRPEDLKPGQLIKVCLITGANRWLARAISIPLYFDPETGRYTPRAEDADPAAATDDEEIPAAPPQIELEIESGLRGKPLTPKERENVALYQKGMSEPEIAKHLKVVNTSTGKHLDRAVEKLGLPNREALRGIAHVE